LICIPYRLLVPDFKKPAELNPQNTNAIEMLKQLEREQTIISVSGPARSPGLIPHSAGSIQRSDGNASVKGRNFPAHGSRHSGKLTDRPEFKETFLSPTRSKE
jgi:hypothetical protein